MTMSLTAHSSRILTSAVCLASLLTIAGCGRMTQDAGGLDELAELQLVEEMRAGSATDPDRGLSRTWNATRDRDGRTYAFDAADSKIKVFNPDGEFSHTIGRPGQGPGEFTSVGAIGVVGDTLWASSSAFGCRSRILLFDLSGQYIGSSAVPGVRVQLHQGIGVVQPGRVRPDGTRIGEMDCFTGGAPDVVVDVSPTDTVRVPIVLFDLRGTIIDTIGWIRRPPSADGSPLPMFTIEGRNHPLPRPPASGPINITVSDGRLQIRRDPPQTASEGEIRITGVSFTDDTVYSVRHRYTAIPYSGSMLDTLAARSAAIPGGSYRIVNGMPEIMPFQDPVAAAAQIRSRMAFPEFPPSVRESFVGADGSLWLQREDDSGPTNRWDIFDPRGRARGQVRLSRSSRVAWSDGATVLVIEQDENDIPWLVSYRIMDGRG